MSDLSKYEVRIVPIGGLGEIGMNCMLIETATTAILIDVGLMFSDLDHFGVEFLIPNFKIFEKLHDKFKGIVCTHGHEDHVGALPHALKAGIRCPVYASPFTSLMIRERLKEHDLSSVTDLRTFKPGEVLEIGDLKIKTVPVNHSIVDSVALIIDSPAGKIIHTGDFKLDPSPYFGDVLRWADFKQAGEDGVRLLLSDSTNVERHEHALPEDVIAKRFEEIFAAAQGLTVVTLFSSNVGRIGVLLETAKKTGKRIALTGRSVEQNIRLAAERECYTIDSGLIVPIEDIQNYKRSDVVVLASGCQGEPRAAMTRIAMDMHPHVKVGPNDQVLYSSKFIPGNEVPISRVINQLFRNGAEVFYESVDNIHTSGHATQPELKKMIEMVKPECFVPIHGEYRHLVLHAELADQCGISPMQNLVLENGDELVLTKSNLEVRDRWEDLRILVEGRQGQEITKAMLRDRRKIAESGVVFVLAAQEAQGGKVLTKPEIHARGLVHESLEPFVLEEAAKVANKVVQTYNNALKSGFYDRDLEEELRLEVRRFLERNIGKKAVVIPLLIHV